MLKPSCECFCGDASEQHTHRSAHTSSQVAAEHLVLRRVWIRPHRSPSTFDLLCRFKYGAEVSDFFSFIINTFRNLPSFHKTSCLLKCNKFLGIFALLIFFFYYFSRSLPAPTDFPSIWTVLASSVLQI